ncbi:MAG: hypothetical protein ABIT58_01005 [Ferruginibacter sp.]
MQSENVLKQIGPWDGERMPAPTGENVRLNFLVSDGIYFGQGPFNVLEKDKMGGPALKSAAKLMNFMIDKLAINK